MMRSFYSRFRTVALLTAATCLLALPSAQAYVDDAHSMCMEMATPYVAKGFQVRQDYWKGEVKNAEPKQLKAQLFKGNEYWFWLGTDADEAELELKVVDAKGNAIQAETKKGNMAIGVRVLPPKTGSFTFIFSVKSSDSEKVHWALAYAYR